MLSYSLVQVSVASFV